MKLLQTTIALLLLLGIVLGPGWKLDSNVASGAEVSSIKPNVVFIMADDLGWRDLGCFGSRFHETPNLDRLAQRGLRLTQAYAASPLCSPTRSSILTGLYPARTGITSPACHLPAEQLTKRLAAGKQPQVKVLNADSLTRLKTEYYTMAESFRDAGYKTAHFGKWHLGHNTGNPNARYEPKDQGFELDFPHTPNAAGPGGGYLAPWKFIRDPAIQGEAGEHIENRMSSEAAKYIHEQKDAPFYLNYWAYSVHSPWNARQDYIDRYAKKADPKDPQHNPLYAAMVQSLDDGVGRLMQAVEDAGIADRTIFVFFSDNGGWAYPPKATDPKGYEETPATSNLPLRSGKASLYEGGTREPCIVVWPNKIKPGSSNDSLFSSVDWYPTLHAMCGLSLPSQVTLDGYDQSEMLQGADGKRQTLFCHFPHGSVAQSKNIPGFLPGSYIRHGNWKLLRFYADQEDGSDRLELYDLQQDVGETRNLVSEQPNIVQDLLGRMDGFLRDTEAVIPIRNPNYDAKVEAPSETSNERPGKSKTPTASQDDFPPSFLGWKVRNGVAKVENGNLSLSSDQEQPFLGVALASKGPLEILVQVRAPQGGKGKIEWLAPKGNGEGQGAPESIPFSIEASPQKGDPKDFQKIRIQVPHSGPIGILRVYLPAQNQTVEVDWIEVQSNSQPKRWDF